MNISGKTTEDKLVIKGTFQMFDTKGMPLPVLFALMNKQGMVPDFIDFYKQAKKAGWKRKTILNRLEEAYLDGFDKNFWKNVKDRILIFERLHLENTQ